jgi:hypothetical protein
MEFTADKFASQFSVLQDTLEIVSAPHCGTDQFIHVSFHYSNSSSAVAVTEKVRPVCWVHISENEYVDKNPNWNLRRSDTRTLRSCTITFWSDGRRFECCEETREAYHTTVAWWLKAYVRNEAADSDARAEDDFGVSHSHHHEDDFGVIEGCDGKYENDYIEFEPEEEDNNESIHWCRDARMYAKRYWVQKA